MDRSKAIEKAALERQEFLRTLPHPDEIAMDLHQQFKERFPELNANVYYAHGFDAEIHVMFPGRGELARFNVHVAGCREPQADWKTMCSVIEKALDKVMSYDDR